MAEGLEGMGMGLLRGQSLGREEVSKTNTNE
jgi:hypothetical protein